ncbi:ribonuclease E/G [Kiloniella antarctica]|uniref:Ribonuclease E/G n=1 Tax=Kiloniella antarctica TaxID=1550907 RepID=A0ABW5BP66_9PROT
MSAAIYIDYLPGQLRAVCVEDDSIHDLLVIRDDKPVYIGNKYSGRIVAIDKGLDAAFVEIGLDIPGFLPRNEIPKSIRDQGLSEGQYLSVIVTREGADGKGVKLRAFLETPEDKKVCLLDAPDPLLRWLSRLSTVDLEDIYVTDAMISRRIKGALAGLDREYKNVRLVADKPHLFEINGFEEALEVLLQVDVPLPSGGSLIIEQGRTLTAIDVNKGSMQHNGGAEKLHYELNLEAAREIARQLRLRNIAGRILIDFTSMKSMDHRKNLQAILKAELKLDYAGHKLFPLYHSGIQELTRKRAGRSLQELLLRPIGIGGLGQVPDPYTQVFTALRKYWAISSSSLSQTHNPKTPRIMASPSVINILKNSVARAYVEDRIGYSVLCVEECLFDDGMQSADYRVEV